MKSLLVLLMELEEINEELEQGELTKQRTEYLLSRKLEIEELIKHADTLK